MLQMLKVNLKLHEQVGIDLLGYQQLIQVEKDKKKKNEIQNKNHQVYLQNL